MSLISISRFEITLLLTFSCTLFVYGQLPKQFIPPPPIPTTLDGPFKPVTVPFNTSLRGKAIDLPDTDIRVQRVVQGFEPEQISISLSTSHDSVWISWVTGSISLFHALIVLSLLGILVSFSSSKSSQNRIEMKGKCDIYIVGFAI